MRSCATWSAPIGPTSATTAGRRGARSRSRSSIACSGAAADGRGDAPRHPERSEGSPRSRRDLSRALRMTTSSHSDGSLRLSKRMSELGLSSRREADEWIARGWVRVDDQVVSELGSRVLPHQRITVDAKAKYQQAQRVTVLVHKPVGYVSGQAEDGYEPA